MFTQCLSEVDINSATVKQVKILNEFAVFLRFCFDPHKTSDCGEFQELTFNGTLQLVIFDKITEKIFLFCSCCRLNFLINLHLNFIFENLNS